MEKDLQRLIAQARQTVAFWRHRFRHAVDEIQDRFASWRPIPIETQLLEKPAPRSLRLVFSEYCHQHPRLPIISFFYLLFLVSLAGGYGLKFLAKDSLTLGHEDYRLIPAERLYPLNALRERALAGGALLTAPTKPNYPTCTEDVDMTVDGGGL